MRLPPGDQDVVHGFTFEEALPPVLEDAGRTGQEAFGSIRVFTCVYCP